MGNDTYRQIIEVAYELSKADKQLKENIKKTQEQYKVRFGVELDKKSASKAIESVRKELEKIKSLQSSGSINSSIANSISQYNKLSNVTSGLSTDFKQLRIQQELLGNSSTDEELISNYEKFNTTLSKVNNQMKVLSKVQSTGLSNSKLTSDFDKLGYNLTTFLKSNPKTAREMGNEFTTLESKIKSAAKSADPVEYKKLSAEFSTLKAKAESLGNVGQTAMSKLAQNTKLLMNYLGSATILFQAINTVKKMATSVIELDSAMTNLRKVSNASEAQFKSFLSTATINAKTLGASIADVVNSTADFARLGYSLPDATELARVATLYSNVGDIDTSAATTSIISTMKAWTLSANQAESIVDIFNEVGNKFAISSAGIGDSLQKSASSLVEANNTLSEATALTVGANDVMQDPEAVGTMWKTVSMRIRSAKTELEEAGLETENMVTSTADLQKIINGMTGFNILEDDGKTFKSTYDIIVGIGEQYKKLSDIDQASLLETLAGRFCLCA